MPGQTVLLPIYVQVQQRAQQILRDKHSRVTITYREGIKKNSSKCTCTIKCSSAQVMTLTIFCLFTSTKMEDVCTYATCNLGILVHAICHILSHFVLIPRPPLKTFICSTQLAATTDSNNTRFALQTFLGVPLQYKTNPSAHI